MAKSKDVHPGETRMGNSFHPTPSELTRYLTAEEREKIDRIELDPHDLEQFMKLMKQGLLRAACRHDAAVQDNFALRAETSIRLTRPVYNSETGLVDQLVGDSQVGGEIRGKKIYKDTSSRDNSEE
jgi:hypothetical protein